MPSTIITGSNLAFLQVTPRAPSADRILVEGNAMALLSEQSTKIHAGQSFVRARARLKRLSDGACFAGYIESINHIGISIRLNASELRVERGDEFCIDVTGHRAAVALSVEVIAVEGAVIHHAMLRPVAFHEKQQDVRLLMFGDPCRINHEGADFPAMSIDIAENGLGILTSASLEAGAMVDFNLSSFAGEVRGRGEIRYCQPDIAVKSQFRAGILVTELTEDSKLRWGILMNSAPKARTE